MYNVAQPQLGSREQVLKCIFCQKSFEKYASYKKHEGRCPVKRKLSKETEMVGQKLRTVTINFLTREFDLLEHVVHNLCFFPSRSEAVRTAVSEWLQKMVVYALGLQSITQIDPPEIPQIIASKKKVDIQHISTSFLDEALERYDYNDQKMKVATVNLSVVEIKAIDYFVDVLKFFPSRSEAVRRAVSEWLQKMIFYSGGARKLKNMEAKLPELIHLPLDMRKLIFRNF